MDGSGWNLLVVSFSTIWLKAALIVEFVRESEAHNRSQSNPNLRSERSPHTTHHKN